MKLYSTKDPQSSYELRQAVLDGLAPDGGLFMPHQIEPLPSDFWKDFYSLTFKELCVLITQHLLAPAVPPQDARQIVERALVFEAPLKHLSEHISVLELFHGPSLAFKDFGAQFMAQLMSYFHADSSHPLIILVATSGDTGGAVAAGFYEVPGMEIVILFPKDKVSVLQEKQLTTFKSNVTAIEINGTFDDCQSLVKEAFVDQTLRQRLNLSSANSINIARLIPQSFYYFEALRQLGSTNQPVAVSVPSGNFGNLTAGLIAKRLGAPIQHFIASTNINDVVPIYLSTGSFEARPSIATISNAMDVGNPSNFERMLHLYGSTWNELKNDITGFSFTDSQTKRAIRTVYEEYQYLLDPHGAVAFLGLSAYLHDHPSYLGILLATAHHSKFKNTIDRTLGFSTSLHPTLEKLKNIPGEAHGLPAEFHQFKEFLLGKYAV